MCLAILAVCFRTEGRSVLVPTKVVGEEKGVLAKRGNSGLNLDNRSSVLEISCGVKEHMSVVIGDRLYVLGGKIRYKKSSGISTESNEYIRFINLEASFRVEDAGANTFRYNISEAVPEISQGHLWPDRGQLVIIGGKTETVNTSTVGYTPPSDKHEVWRYLSAQSGGPSRWVTVNMTGERIPRAFASAGTYVDGLRKGFLLGGLVSNESMADISPAEREKDIGGLAIWDGQESIWKKEDTPWEKRHAARSFYLDYGTSGLLIYIGGMAGSDTTFSFDQIDIYDIANHKWHQQTATGHIPTFRKNFCGVVLSAQDRTSHQIYIFGGSDKNGRLNNDIYILNLPTFAWKKAFSEDSNNGLSASAPTPREHMTCNIVSGKDLLVYGGDLTKGEENCNQTDVFLFDLSTWTWKDRYVSGMVVYTVPVAIIDDIGGSALGGATKTKPTAGFETKDIETLFYGAAAGTTPNDSGPGSGAQPTSSDPPKSGTSPGVIAGAAICGVLVIAAVIGGYFYYRCWGQPRPVELDSSPAKLYEKCDDRRPPIWPPQELPVPKSPVDVTRFRAELSESNYGLYGAQ
ncbi:hypothetical protein L873DRAFT_1799206 [Choiromyces venosus 120613-1]|uniref:Galactose oxidase n=1 Tax=Choiromyces venosus 120613-1 TaxID=1336337 RepID=A0A3N4K1C3_9PEZI|nr:hypothetical protein L873DRAFT_1799206 [Choiromyces venosus 120613-1]